MTKISRRSLLASMVTLPVISADDPWVELFDGKSMNGWRASENSSTWSVKDGCLEASGPRSHLFYAGAERQADFRNFELKAEVYAYPGANSGIFIHTEFQPSGWPSKGYEIQVCNNQPGSNGYIERKKTGSLYGVRNVYKTLVPDGEWFELHVTVRGSNVQIRLNGTLLVDFVEPDPSAMPGSNPVQRLGHGTFALQAHDPASRVRYRKVLVRPLPDVLAEPAAEKPRVDDVYRNILRLSGQNYPVVDYHVHLKGGWTLEEALSDSRKVGIQYGIAVNCGVGFPITNDDGIRKFLLSMAGQPVFLAMQAEGREWVKMFSPEAVSRFDYVFSDAMTFADNQGKRMRLWIPAEVGTIADRQQFMELIVDRIVGVLNKEPIDIYVNPTFLPEVMAAEYDALWTPERMSKVIEAAVKNDIAIEINNRYKIPSARFIKLAREEGAKFSLGTNNVDRNLGRLEYCLRMVDECGLKWQDIFVPKPDGQKPIQKRGF